MILGRFVAAVLITLLTGATAGAADAPATLLTVNPIVLQDKSQNKEVIIRVTAPMTGTKLPLILFAHGAAYSKDDYLTLPEFWAAHGYVVVQPTFIDSETFNLPPKDPRRETAWRSRVLDMRHVLDSLDEIEKRVPTLRGRIDRTKVVAAGHSFGGHTVAALVGGRMPDTKADLHDPRVMAGIMMAPPPYGPGFRNLEWAADSKPALIIVGNQDVSPGFADKWEAHADYYYKTDVGNRCLAVMNGMKHYLGGILGTHRTEDETPNPASVAEIERMTLAFLDTQTQGANAWPTMARELSTTRPAVIAQFACK